MSSKKMVAIVSGGSRGLGQGITYHLLECGYAIATFSRQKTDFIEEISAGKYKDNFYWESLDGANFSGLNKFVKNTVQHFGTFWQSCSS